MATVAMLGTRFIFIRIRIHIHISIYCYRSFIAIYVYLYNTYIHIYIRVYRWIMASLNILMRCWNLTARKNELLKSKYWVFALTPSYTTCMHAYERGAAYIESTTTMQNNQQLFSNEIIGYSCIDYCIFIWLYYHRYRYK